jgi:Ni,Fe-hydrogenase III small subunit
MAWKKIIFSGSAGELSSLAVDGNITGTFVGALSSSAQIASDISGSSTSLSASIASDIAAANSGSFSGSFQGDGSALTNITVDQSATIASSFTNQTSVAVSHNFDSKNVTVTVYNSSDVLILPASVTLTNSNTATVTFDSSTSGRIVVAKGGHIVSGSVSADNIDGLDAAVVAALPANVVSASAFTSPSQGTVRATINGANTDVDTGLQTGDSPQFTNLTLTGNLTVQGSTTTIDSTTIDLGDNILAVNGTAAALGGLHVNDSNGPLSGSILWDGTNNKWIAGASGSEVGLALLEGQSLVSGAAQLTYADIPSIPTVGDGGLTTNDFTDADHNKLDGIEASADVTDTANVTAAGALMDSELAEIATVKALTAAGISGSFTAVSASIASDIANQSQTITLSADSGTNDTYTTGETLTFAGANGLSTVVSDNQIQITAGGALLSGSAQIAADISGSSTALSASIATDIAGISTDFDDITNKPALISASAEGAAQGQITLNGAAVNVNALGTDDSPSFTNLTVNGDLTVTGNTFEAQVSNLNVEDKFILVNSGSQDGDSGIVFGGSVSGSAANIGHAIFWDNDTDVFGFSTPISSSATTATATSKIGNIETAASADPSSQPTLQGKGTIFINEDSEAIFIYS